MSLIVELSPEVEDRLRLVAARRGDNAEQYAKILLEQQFPPHQPLPFWVTATPEQRLERFDAWIESHDPSLPPLPEEAYSRESFYEDDRL